MVDADKPEAIMGSGYDSLHRHLWDLLREPRAKTSPAHAGEAASSAAASSNGIKMKHDDSIKEKSELREKSTGNKKANRFHSYSKDKNSGSEERRVQIRTVFISNIPCDMKWQAIKALLRDKGGEVAYGELKDVEGKPRACGVVEFKDEFFKKALETMKRYILVEDL